MTKTCTKCGIEYPATTEFFHHSRGGFCSQCKQCRLINCKRYYQRCRQRRQKYQQQYYQEHRQEIKQIDKQRHKRYRQTLRGFVVCLISNIKNRCYNTNHRSYPYYGKYGIRLCFTPDELLQWLENNQIDPRGLKCHRIDNNGNYTLDNIEFLTGDGHIKKHRELKKDSVPF